MDTRQSTIGEHLLHHHQPENVSTYALSNYQLPQRYWHPNVNKAFEQLGKTTSPESTIKGRRD